MHMENLDKVALRGSVHHHALSAAGYWAQTGKMLALASALLAAPILSSGQSLDMDQMANGNLSAATLVLNWQNGNLNKSNSHFLTTYSVPYRVKIDGLLPNTQYTYVGGIDIRVQGKNALDMFTTTSALTRTPSSATRLKS